MKKIFFILLFFISLFSQAQITFQKIYGYNSDFTPEEGTDLIQVSDGNFLVLGVSSNEIYLFKIKNNGDTLWSKYFLPITSSGEFVKGNALIQTSDKGYIIAGYIEPTGTLVNQQSLLIKTDSLGNILWSNSYGATNSYSSASNILQTSDGGYLFTGYLNGDLEILKTDPSGNIQWSKINHNTNANAGNHLEKTSDGGYIITGVSTNSTSQSKILLIKTDVSGNISWAKNYGDTVQSGNYIKQTSDGGFILICSGYENNLYDDMILLKTSSTGIVQWTKKYSGIADIDGQMIYELNSGEYIITGLNSGASLIKTNNIGDTLWGKSYNIPSNYYTHASSLTPTTDGGFIFCGNISMPGDTESVYVVKTDSNGSGVCYNSIPAFTISNVSLSTSSPAFTTSSLSTTASISFQTSSWGQVRDACSFFAVNELSVEKNIVSIFPNPFSTETTISINGQLQMINGEFIMYDVFGRVVKNFKPQSLNFKLERGNLPSGIYFYKVSADGKNLGTGKVVVE